MSLNRQDMAGVPDPVQRTDSRRLADLHMAAGVDLVAYADGTAPVDVQREVEGHLRGCLPCSDAVAELRSLLLLVELAQLDDGDGVSEPTLHADEP